MRPLDHISNANRKQRLEIVVDVATRRSLANLKRTSVLSATALKPALPRPQAEREMTDAGRASDEWATNGAAGRKRPR